MKKIIIISLIVIAAIIGVACSMHSSASEEAPHPSTFVMRSSAQGLIEGTVYGMNITTDLSNFGTAFVLLPDQIQDKCIQSYQEITASGKSRLTYGGIKVTHPSDTVWTFAWDTNKIKITASQDELNKIFRYND